jgi:hypothetical protein
MNEGISSILGKAGGAKLTMRQWNLPAAFGMGTCMFLEVKFELVELFQSPTTIKERFLSRVKLERNRLTGGVCDGDCGDILGRGTRGRNQVEREQARCGKARIMGRRDSSGPTTKCGALYIFS